MIVLNEYLSFTLDAISVHIKTIYTAFKRMCVYTGIATVIVLSLWVPEAGGSACVKNLTCFTVKGVADKTL